MKAKTFFTTIILSVLSLISKAQDFDKAKLDRYFDTLEAHDKFMGSVAVSKKGKVIYTRSIGYCDVDAEQNANVKSKYRIGSISKTFTTVLVMKAVEEGKLSLEQTIDSYFPKIDNAKRITIAYLLQHRSGIHNVTQDENYLEWSTKPHTEKQMVERIRKGGSDFEPGSEAKYSNSNFILLTYILEHEYKQDYGILLEEKITKPLGLEDTHMGGTIDPANNDCYSYSYIGKWKKESETDMSVPEGAGAIVSTPVDLVKFSDALFGGELLEEQYLDKMKTIKDHYGMGLFEFPFGEQKGLGHTGGIDAFSSVFSYFEESDISYALTSNSAGSSDNDISIVVLSAVNGETFEIPEFVTYDVTPEDLKQYVGIYTSEQLPLEITITREGATLLAQASGQSQFALDASAEHEFVFEPAGVEMIFNPEKNTMTLKQGGGVFAYTKK